MRSSRSGSRVQPARVSRTRGSRRATGRSAWRSWWEGERVRPGDWIVGDLSGVVVVPRERAAEIANRALDVLEHENRVREEIQRGSTLSAVQKLERWERVG